MSAIRLRFSIVLLAGLALAATAQAQEDRQRTPSPPREALFLPTASLMLSSDLKLTRRDYGRAEFSYNLGVDETNVSALSFAIRLNPKREVLPKLPYGLELVPIAFLIAYDAQVRPGESGSGKAKYSDSFGYLSGLFLTLVKDFGWHGYLVGIGQIEFDGVARYGDPAASSGVLTRLTANAFAAGILLFPPLRIQNISLSFIYLHAYNDNYEIDGTRASVDLTLRY